MTLTYNVTALEMTIYFNKEGDHDHNGLLFALTKNVPILKYIRAVLSKASGGKDDPDLYYDATKTRADVIGMEILEGPDAEKVKEARRKESLCNA